MSVIKIKENYVPEYSKNIYVNTETEGLNCINFFIRGNNDVGCLLLQLNGEDMVYGAYTVIYFDSNQMDDYVFNNREMAIPENTKNTTDELGEDIKEFLSLSDIDELIDAISILIDNEKDKFVNNYNYNSDFERLLRIGTKQEVKTLTYLTTILRGYLLKLKRLKRKYYL